MSTRQNTTTYCGLFVYILYNNIVITLRNTYFFAEARPCSAGAPYEHNQNIASSIRHFCFNGAINKIVSLCMYFALLKYLMTDRVLNAPRAWVQKKSAPGGKVFPCLQCLRRAQEKNRLPQHWKRALYHSFGQRLCYNLPIDLHCLRVQTCYPRFRILRIPPRSTLFRRGLLLH